MYAEEIERELESDFRFKVDLKLERAYVVGAGDSYASALVVEGETGGRFLAVDPYDGANRDLTDRPVIFVSISGKPFYNVKLAKSLRSKTETFALTSNPSSDLALNVDHSIRIPYSSRTALPGVLSFLMSSYALLEIAGIRTREEKINTFPLQDHPFFVGSKGNYGVAYYAYLKMSEVFGNYSNAERTEQFCHSPIFSSKGRQVVIFGDSEREMRLAEMMDNSMITLKREPLNNARAFLYSLVRKMREEGRDKIFYLDCRKILNISSSMIYYDSGE